MKRCIVASRRTKGCNYLAPGDSNHTRLAMANRTGPMGLLKQTRQHPSAWKQQSHARLRQSAPLEQTLPHVFHLWSRCMSETVGPACSLTGTAQLRNWPPSREICDNVSHRGQSSASAVGTDSHSTRTSWPARLQHPSPSRVPRPGEEPTLEDGRRGEWMNHRRCASLWIPDERSETGRRASQVTASYSPSLPGLRFQTPPRGSSCLLTFHESHFQGS